MTDLLFYSSSPVFNIDGSDRGELARDLLELDIEESVAGLKMLHATFVAIGPRGSEAQEQLLYLDGNVLDFGKPIKVSLGPPSQQRIVFDGLISALEVQFDEGGEPRVSICAEDKLMSFRMTRRMRTYEDMSDADIASDIATQHGLSADVQVQGPTYDRIQQWNMSDLAFLRERARLLQAEIWIENDALNFKTRDARQGTTLTLVQGNELISVRASADLADQRTGINVSGYDAQQRESIDENVGNEVIAAEIQSGRTGPSILQAALGERVSHRVREVPLNGAEAAEWARAEMLRRARAFVRVNGVTNGSPDMVVGSLLTLENIGQPFSGAGYYVTRVKQRYDLQQGHRTVFEAERATVGNAP